MYELDPINSIEIFIYHLPFTLKMKNAPHLEDLYTISRNWPLGFFEFTQSIGQLYCSDKTANDMIINDDEYVSEENNEFIHQKLSQIWDYIIDEDQEFDDLFKFIHSQDYITISSYLEVNFSNLENG